MRITIPRGAAGRPTRRGVRRLAGAAAGLLLAACSNAAEPQEPPVDPTVVLTRFPVADREHSAFPSSMRLRNGDVLVTWREGKDHIYPPGRIMMARFRYVDGQIQRLETTELFDSRHNEREASLVELADGTLVANVFSSRLGDREWFPFVTVLRSVDGGRTWADTVTITGPDLRDGEGREFRWVASRSAAVEESPGRLLMPVYAPVGDDDRRSSHVLGSDDGGRSWSFVATVARNTREEYNETSLLPVGSRVVAVIRSEDGYLRQSESHDGGHTWGGARKLPVWGIPAHLLHLSDGAVLLARGYRRDAMGVRYTLSGDGGLTWDTSVEGVLEEGCESDDCGYPTSVQFDDGSLFTVYYSTKGGRTGVEGVHYRIEMPAAP